jgi:hypothetical protein
MTDMARIQPIMTRIAYVTTENTGGALDVNGPEGQVQFRRVDPHGVVVQFGPGVQLSIHKDLLPLIGRFFLGAALLLDVPINEGWDAPQWGGHHDQ